MEVHSQNNSADHPHEKEEITLWSPINGNYTTIKCLKASKFKCAIWNLNPAKLITAAINMHGSPRQAEQLIIAP